YYIIKNWLPFVIKVGATRKNIFVSFALYFTSLAIISSLIALVIQEVLTPLATWLDLDIFSFMHLANFLNGAWYERLFIDIILCLFLFAISFLLGIINYRYGLVVSLSFIALLFIIVTLGLFSGWMGDFFIYLYNNFDLLLFAKMGILTMIIYGIT